MNTCGRGVGRRTVRFLGSVAGVWLVGAGDEGGGLHAAPVEDAAAN